MPTWKNGVRELAGLISGFHYCQSESGCIIEPEEIMCIVCVHWGLSWKAELVAGYFAD